MKRINVLVLIGLFLGLYGCVVNSPIERADQQGGIKIGMSLNDVAATVGRQPNCSSDSCKTEHEADGDYFIWIVSESAIGSNMIFTSYATYKFTFKNNILVSYGNRGKG